MVKVPDTEPKPAGLIRPFPTPSIPPRHRRRLVHEKTDRAFHCVRTRYVAPFSVDTTDAQAALKSTYTDTASCVTLEEGEDRFTLSCAAPGGAVNAILSYWDGRALVAYEPYYKPGGKARQHTIADSASRAFGPKIEWRMQDGGQAACAAIVRIYSNKAGILFVSNLATGKHVGDASTNAQAHKLADRACRSDAAASQPDIRPSIAAVSPTSEGRESVKEAALRGQKPSMTPTAWAAFPALSMTSSPVMGNSSTNQAAQASPIVQLWTFSAAILMP